ncbi:pyruvyl transferase EpsI [Neobacillus niacini]|uniref:polysaccharide pyruvyl transferase family protein n=1 Tax=Neobacillus niacini TaxID=86668 RepID=UPI0027845838|nr:polysaccharide pyruvyl transferase family protein [Neobacillus niacini]MDQ1000339.1 pyruvyl transferase EpsI [Neobacillus niacini]
MIIIKSIKRFIPLTIKKALLKIWESQQARRKLDKFIQESNKNRIFLIGTPKHGNLGDQAIAHAEMKFLEENCKDFDIFEIQFDDFTYYFKALTKVIEPKNIIMLHGGGNMGVEYLREEELRRRVIVNFKDNKIISFPQTIYFGNTDFGKKELKKTINIYNSHPNLTIIAREEISLQMMRGIFTQNNVILTPDIVMYLNEDKFTRERKDILFCFRDDTEKVISSELKKKLYNELSNQNNIIITDTVVSFPINKDIREEELNKIWTSIRQSKLVITDRLHGMVFAAITSTPCIALSNYNQKVKGTYNWIKHLPYIKFVEDESDIYNQINEMMKINHSKYNNNFAMKYYNEIINSIKS